MIYLSNPTSMARIAADAIAQGCGHTGELLLASGRGEIACTLLGAPTTVAPLKWLKRATLPTIAVIGDDPGDVGLGPAAWPAARRLIEWANFAVVHGSGGTVHDYRAIITLAKQHRRLLLIECTSALADDWAGALMRRKPRRIPFAGLLPIDGPHPIVARGVVAQ